MSQRALLLAPSTPRHALERLARDAGWVVAESWPRTQVEHGRKAWWFAPDHAVLYLEIASIYARVLLLPSTHVDAVTDTLRGDVEVRVETLEQVLERMAQAHEPHAKFEAFLQTAAFQLDSSGDPEYASFVTEHLDPGEPLLMRGALLIIETLGWATFANTLKLQIPARPDWAGEMAQVLARIEAPDDRA